MSPKTRSAVEIASGKGSKEASKKNAASSVSHHNVAPKQQSRRSTEKATSQESSSVRLTRGMSTQQLRTSSRAAVVSTTKASRVTRSSASARSSQIIEIADETPAHDVEATIEQKLPPSPEVATAPTESPLADITPTMPTLIGESGSYQIFRLRATLSEKEKATHAKHPNDSVMLGLKFEPKDWMGKRLQTSFKMGHTNYTTVSAVKRGSIAERAGVHKDDILVWWSREGPEPVVYHQLLGSAVDNGDVVWEFINEDMFEAKQPSDMLKAFGAFKFYVARPKVPDSDVSTPAKRLSTLKVNLGPEIVRRAQCFNSLTLGEKDDLLLDAKDDAQKSFEKDRDAIIKSLPKAIVDAFYQIGFAAWGQKKPITYTPVLVLSPFSIAPGPVRHKWLDMHQKVGNMRNTYILFLFVSHAAHCFFPPSLVFQKCKKLHTMHHLVYFYGVTDPNNQFALLSQLKFLSLAHGTAQNCHLLPVSIQKKLRRKQKLTAAEDAKVRAQDEMERDVPKKPEERLSGKIPPFAELYSSISEFDLSELAKRNGTGVTSGGKRASDKSSCSRVERHLKRRATSITDSSTSALAFSSTASVSDTSIIVKKPRPSKLSKYTTARKIATTENLQPPEKRQRRSQTVSEVPPSTRDGSEVPAAPLPPAQAKDDLTPPAPPEKTQDVGTKAADEEASSAILPVARGNGNLPHPAPSEDKKAPTGAELQGFVGIAEVSKLSAASTKHAKLGQIIVETNKTLWAEYLELQDEFNTLRERHQTAIVAFKKLCKTEDGEGNREDDDAKAKAAASTGRIVALEELHPPIDSGTGSDWYYEYSQFVRKADLQNVDLAKAIGQLKENISDLKKRHTKLHALQQEHARLQALQHELAKKVIELAN